METKTLFTTLLMLALVTAGRAQTLDKAKLDRFFDRLLEKNKGMGSLALVKDGNVVLQPLLRLQADQRERKETFDRGDEI